MTSTAPPTPASSAGSDSPVSVLIVEDNPTLSATYTVYLRPLNAAVRTAENGTEALRLFASHKPTLVLLDLNLPDMHGLDVLRQMKKTGQAFTAIVITAHGSVKIAVEAMREGASDFLLKPFSAERLMTTVQNSLEIARLSSLVDREEPDTPSDFGGFIGESPSMKALYKMIAEAAPSRASVFIVGESGTGKELTAEQIHQLSPRVNKPFVAINCAAIPSNLMESEIFGHTKGAFTGAVAAREGAAVRADGGTLFLDEICDMPLDLQAKLLRFVQTGQVVPVGSNQMQQVDVRFVCATNRDPWMCVEHGEFREDLYYRLHVIPVFVPALRERGDDVIRIAEAMVARFAQEEKKAFVGLTPQAKTMLRQHHWPGNVRELGNLIQSVVVLHNDTLITDTMLSRLLGPRLAPDTPTDNVTPITPATSQMAQPAHTPLRRPSDLMGQPRQSPPQHTPVQSPMQPPIQPSVQPPMQPPHTPSKPAGLAAGDATAVHAPLQGAQPVATIAEVERQAAERALEATGGHVADAAQRLGIGTATLYRRIRAWGINPRDFRSRSA